MKKQLIFEYFADEIARLGLKKEEDLSTKSKCVVTFGDKSWYVEGDED